MNVRDPNIIPFPGTRRGGTLVLRVELVLMPSPVWRRVRISDEATFWDLHVAIQDVVGWSHRHRHVFAVDHPDTGQRLRLGLPENGGFHGRGRIAPGWEVRVRDIARPDHPPFLYTYHLGEQWQHEVSLEGAEPETAGHEAPACLGGEGACPPEGCGGPDRYAELLASGAVVAGGFAPDEVAFCDPGALWRDLHGGDGV
jgi:hypothetical protein